MRQPASPRPTPVYTVGLYHLHHEESKQTTLCAVILADIEARVIDEPFFESLPADGCDQPDPRRADRSLDMGAIHRLLLKVQTRLQQLLPTPVTTQGNSTQDVPIAIVNDFKQVSEVAKTLDGRLPTLMPYDLTTTHLSLTDRRREQLHTTFYVDLAQLCALCSVSLSPAAHAAVTATSYPNDVALTNAILGAMVLRRFPDAQDPELVAAKQRLIGF